MAAADPAAAKVLTADRCAAILRATYADETDSMLVTVGVAVMPSNSAARAAGQPAEIRCPPACAWRGSPAPWPRGFTNHQRQLSWSMNEGPYLIMSSAGYSDGRPQVQESSDHTPTTR